MLRKKSPQDGDCVLTIMTVVLSFAYFIQWNYMHA